MSRTQNLFMAIVVVLITGFPSGSALAGNAEFNAVIRGLEREFGLKPKKVPGMWLAKCILKATHPSGVLGLDMVLYKKPSFEGRVAARDFGARVQAMLGAGWKPFVQVEAPKRQERVLLFARPHGRRMEIFVLSLEADEGVALLVQVHPEVFQRMIDHPTSGIPGKG